jgi:hypothetical protein
MRAAGLYMGCVKEATSRLVLGGAGLFIVKATQYDSL